MSVYDKHCPRLQIPPSNHQCNFCGGTMRHGKGGHWGCDVEILCCSQCAIKVLPIFLADSIYAENLDEAQNKVSGAVMATLQRALASRAEWRNWNGPALVEHLDKRWHALKRITGDPGNCAKIQSQG